MMVLNIIKWTELSIWGKEENFLINVQEGETFRFIPWNSFSFWEDIKLEENFNEDKDSILIQLNIGENCYNAGLINCFGESLYAFENETIIPPYSVWKVKKHNRNEIVLDLAKDNSEFGFDMKPAF